jgi:hypothetical protein
VVFLGPPGVGKTMLAVAVAACQAGLSIYYTTFDDLVRQLSIAEAAGRYPKKLQTHLRPAVLIVDEVGYLPLSRTQANMVFQLISRRYERGSTIITGMGAAHCDLGDNLAGAPPPLPGRHGPLGATCSVQDISTHIALDLRARALIMHTAQAPAEGTPAPSPSQAQGTPGGGRRRPGVRPHPLSECTGVARHRAGGRRSVGGVRTAADPQLA